MKLRIVSPLSRQVDDLDTQELLARGNIYGQNYQKIQESPEVLADFTHAYNNNRQDSESKKFIKGKKSEDNPNLLINSNFYEMILNENQNMTIDEDALIQGFNSYYNLQSNINEKQKSQQKIKASNNELSGSKKQSQNSPKKKSQLSISKLIKNSSQQKEQDQSQKVSIKGRRKKSQGKANLNIQNLNQEQQNEAILLLKAQQLQAMRSSSQPQLRSQSQQANSQERQVLLLKKQSVKPAISNAIETQQFQLRQELHNRHQNDNSVERQGSGSVSKTASVKVMIKKNSSVKQINGQQTMKISKEQIQLKQQNYNSQGSGGANQQSSSNLRSRSLSNSKFMKKKQQALPQTAQDTVQQLDDNLFTTRTNSKDNQIQHQVGTSFNQSAFIQSQNNLNQKQRCKSSSKVLNQEEVLANMQIAPQNSSKILMFKTNNEESNAKVAALKSIIKLSSNNNNSYMQNKNIVAGNIGLQNGITVVRSQSKENNSGGVQANQGQQNLQFKNITQKIKMLDGAPVQGQFVQKCSQANQNNLKPPQQQQQFMQRFTQSRMGNQQNLNYHAQLKSNKDNQIVIQENVNAPHTSKDKIDNISSQMKINIAQNNLISGDKETSSSLKLGTGQVNIKNIKISSQQQQQKQQIKENNDNNQNSLNSKAQVIHQQKMHQILLNQQNKNQQQILNGAQSNKNIQSRNTYSITTTGGGAEEQSNAQLLKNDIDKKENSLLKSKGVGSSESIKEIESQKQQILEQFSRKNSTLSNGSLKTQYNSYQKDQYLSSNIKSEVIHQKKHSMLGQKNHNTSQYTYNTQNVQSDNRNQQDQIVEQQTIFSEISQNQKRISQKIGQISEEKGDKRLNFYNQMSPTSEVLSQFKDSQMISAFKNNDDDNCCFEDESIVIIQEDQLRIPLRSVKNSQMSNQNQFFQNNHDLSRDFPTQDQHINLKMESFDSQRSVFKKKHETSVIEQDSLVTQIKTQLIKIHFQQAFQGTDNLKQKRLRNQNKQDSQTMKDEINRRVPMDMNPMSESSLQSSGTYYFEPQFEDLSFEIDTCNQIRVPKNLNKPINEVRIMSLPEDCEIYQENIDPQTGKIRFTLDNKIVKLVKPTIKKNILLRPENQILKSQIQLFKDPIDILMKTDYKDQVEEIKEEEVIQKEIETTLNIIPSLNTNSSVSFRNSTCSNNSYSLNTFLSDDVSLNSQIISQALNNPLNQITAGIMSYAAEKLNVREGDPLFLLPRLNDKQAYILRMALLKREPEWWQSGSELSLNSKKSSDNQPILETFIF